MKTNMVTKVAAVLIVILCCALVLPPIVASIASGKWPLVVPAIAALPTVGGLLLLQKLDPRSWLRLCGIVVLGLVLLWAAVKTVMLVVFWWGSLLGE